MMNRNGHKKDSEDDQTRRSGCHERNTLPVVIEDTIDALQELVEWYPKLRWENL